MDPPEEGCEAVAAPPQRRRLRGARCVEKTLILTICFVILSLLKLEPLARNSVQNHNSKIDMPPLLQSVDTEIQTYTELCEGCRYKPLHLGRTSCGERAQYLIKTYHTSYNEAATKVMKEEPRCAVRRFNVSHIISDIVKIENYTFNGSMYSKLNKTVLDREKPLWGKISIYVYEDDAIPYNLGLGVEKNMTERYSSMNITYENFKADLAIIDLFRSFPGRTKNPAKADFFVVPYPHASHCLQLNTIKGWTRECQHISPHSIREIIGGLMHYGGNEKKHIFINTMEVWHAHTELRNAPLSLTHGPRLNEGGHHIVIPYLSDDPSFQPSAVIKRGKQWWLRPRELSLAYFFGSENRNMIQNFRKYRQLFLEEVRVNWTSPYLGKNLPYFVESLGSHQLHSKNGLGYFSAIYKHSIFCPVLPGDSPPQKRFFDVIIMGCIPVVLAFETDMASQSNTSWHAPHGYPVESSYPFAKQSNSISKENEIDYDSFVVKIKEVGEMRETLEVLLRNRTEIQRLQLNLMNNAQYFLYGMGSDSHLYEDAFAKILQSLAYYSSLLKT
jgi:hypothetical protein